MTTTRRDVTELLSRIMADELDAFLAHHAFKRRADSLQYSRPIAEGTQTISVYFDLNPRYAPGASAHLLPQVSITLPRLNDAVTAMVGIAPNLVASVKTTFSEQLQNAAPRSVRDRATNWFVSDAMSARNNIVSMRAFLDDFILEFLSAYDTVERLVVGFEQADERLPHDRRFLIFIVAAYVLLKRPRDAMRLLDEKFGKATLKRQYARAFEYVSKLLAEER